MDIPGCHTSENSRHLVDAVVVSCGAILLLQPLIHVLLFDCLVCCLTCLSVCLCVCLSVCLSAYAGWADYVEGIHKRPD